MRRSNPAGDRAVTATTAPGVPRQAPHPPAGGRPPDSGRGLREGDPRRRRPRRRLASLLIALAAGLILVAVGVASFPFYTDIKAGRPQKDLKTRMDQAPRGSEPTRLKPHPPVQNQSKPAVASTPA